jgi:hypothetical protein
MALIPRQCILQYWVRKKKKTLELWTRKVSCTVEGGLSLHLSFLTLKTTHLLGYVNWLDIGWQERTIDVGLGKDVTFSRMPEAVGVSSLAWQWSAFGKSQWQLTFRIHSVPGMLSTLIWNIPFIVHSHHTR